MFYEVHVTVASDATDCWVHTCTQLGIKPLLIELSHGQHQRQLMCAAPHAGDNQSATAYVAWLEQQVRAQGFQIVRAKLERPLGDARDGDALAYTEAHWKFVVEPAWAREIEAEARGLHLSRSLLGASERLGKWYLTQRCYDVAPEIAARAFAATDVRLRDRLPVTKLETEAVLLDSNPAVDAGWATA